MAGRRPKPTAIKVLAGNPGKRPLNHAEPKPGAANVRVPSKKLPKDGQELWRALAGPLAELGVLKETDLVALEMLCLHYALARMGIEKVLKEGAVVEVVRITKHENGEVIEEERVIKKHPAASVFRENSAALKSYLLEFGLTPSSRVKIKTDAGEKELSLAEQLFENIDVD